jgi:hypothetical protein
MSVSVPVSVLVSETAFTPSPHIMSQRGRQPSLFGAGRADACYGLIGSLRRASWQEPEAAAARRKARKGAGRAHMHMRAHRSTMSQLAEGSAEASAGVHGAVKGGLQQPV